MSGVSIPPGPVPKCTVTVESNMVRATIRGDGTLSPHEADMLADALRLGAQAARRANASVAAALRDYENALDHERSEGNLQ